MLRDIKSRFKRNTSSPSIRSLKDAPLKMSASAPVLSCTLSPSPPLSRQKEKLPANKSLDNLANRSVNSLHVGDSTTATSSASSSSASLSMPPTPPPPHHHHHHHHHHHRHHSTASTNEFFLNHAHLKPGNQAELLSYNKTITMYRENAQRSNDPTIQCDLAIYLYESSKNNKAYVQEAAKLLKTLSLRGHAESQYYLANIYASGDLHKRNKPDFGNAFPLFLQAAKHQHADAAYRSAKCYEDGLGCLKNKSKAIQYYKLASTLNHPGAMYRLGLAYINGSLGLARHTRDGNKWLKRSADASTREYPHALHELGLLHEKGLDGVIFKDARYSVQLFAQASELGYAPSAYRLGTCFEYGYLKCPQDPASSIFFYTIAARQGHPEACFALSTWYLVDDNTILKPSEEKAFFWAGLAAQKGLAKAEFAMGYFAEVGIGRAQDQQEAVDWYQKAVDQGDAQAKKRLSDLKSSVHLTPSPIPASLVAAGEAKR